MKQCPKCGKGGFSYEADGDLVCGYCGYALVQGAASLEYDSRALGLLEKAITDRARLDLRCRMTRRHLRDCLESNPFTGCVECKRTAWQWLNS